MPALPVIVCTQLPKLEILVVGAFVTAALRPLSFPIQHLIGCIPWLEVKGFFKKKKKEEKRN